jgi:lipoyl-dependent peroxiredoxin
MTTLYTARVHIQGGRDGLVKSDDGRLRLHLAAPTTMGGTGNGTNPEQLFAAGYGACFASTIKAVAVARGKHVEAVEVNAEVDVNLDKGSHGLAVRLTVKAWGVDPATLYALIDGAKAACPYSRATRNNVTTTVTVSA